MKKFPHVLMVSNHWEAKEKWVFSGVFVDRQILSLQKEGVRISTFDIGTAHSPIALFRKLLELRKQVRQLKPDIVHAQYGTIVAFLAAWSGRAVAISYCGSDLLPGASISKPRMFLGFVLSNLAALRARGLICKTDELRRALWWRWDRATVIPNGVDLDLFTAGCRDSARAELGWSPIEPTVLFNAGRDPQNKGLDIAKAAMGIVQNRIPSARLHLLSNVEPRRMPAYYRAADVLLCASRQEGSPNVVKEALACNLPVVSCPVGDVAELLAGVQPSAVVPRDPFLMANAISEILVSRTRSNGRDRIAHLALDRVAKQVLSFYQSLLELPN